MCTGSVFPSLALNPSYSSLGNQKNFLWINPGPTIQTIRKWLPLLWLRQLPAARLRLPCSLPAHLLLQHVSLSGVKPTPHLLLLKPLPTQDLSVAGYGMPSLSASGATIASPDSSLKPELRFSVLRLLGWWRGDNSFQFLETFAKLLTDGQSQSCS